MYIRSTKNSLVIRRLEPTPVRLDDLEAHLGSGLAKIRRALEAEEDLAAVMAARVSDGGSCVLIATRAGVYVTCFDSADGHRQSTERTPWASVRVSPMRPDVRLGPSLACEVRVGDARFVTATGDTMPTGVEAFHDEVVRRGTPWHYPG